MEHEAVTEVGAVDEPITVVEESAAHSVPVIATAGAAVVLIAIVLILLLVRRSKKKTGNQEIAGITLRLEVLYGNVASKKRQFLLTDSLFIGSDSRCAVILPDASPLSARVFLQDGNVFIEDLNSPEGTILGGMRIYAPNPLRSGEQSMIGQVSFSFLY